MKENKHLPTRPQRVNTPTPRQPGGRLRRPNFGRGELLAEGNCHVLQANHLCVGKVDNSAVHSIIDFCPGSDSLLEQPAFKEASKRPKSRGNDKGLQRDRGRSSRSTTDC